jgi:hypothetical protein
MQSFQLDAYHSNMLGLVMFGSALEHYWGLYHFFYISFADLVLLHLGVSYYQIHSVLGELASLNFFSRRPSFFLLNADYRSVLMLQVKMIEG